MKNFNIMLDEYAKLCVEVGINLQKGQPLVINTPIEGADFVRLVTKHAYELGAKEVHVNWNDEILTKMKYENAPMEVFENFPKWYADGMEEYAEDGAGFLSIYSQDPELLKDIDPKKIAAYNKSSSIALKNFRNYTMNDINAWCVVSIPTQGWASRVFPDVSEEEAMEKLWKAIFKSTRMDLEDPIKAWEEHLKNLEEKVNFLNEKKFKKLYYKSSNGTDLEVELPEGHIWAGGGSKNAKDVFFVPNIPTEEVFTMPLKTGVNGVVYSTKPLNYGGNLIDEFKLVFEEGKVVDFEAEQGYEVLKDLLSLDEGAKHLGEVALVPYDSPISNSNIIFLNTLFDENASCHFALGKAYPTNIEGGENMTEEELEKRGVNDSLTHVDFMIGSEDLSIIGETKDGKKVQIFENGNWAF
ncbi:aminopeptidase [Keratinibaculum paraultunense]|uniref:Aminopeptidase n=1 Tax=Keratinibaculum paraultunense TaxID=1278232 RepID=A0A4V2UTT1_9FIRM|nr:aminopeptidase [Keratinibaculum paraultunense]QQY79553.1 aminopeptidase [Keratinibaculum paraultunense]TCS87578.1 aminopeptidase [Keratinibaculum paraultunense]